MGRSHRNNPARTRASAFTLVEMLVVMMIMVVVAGVVVPRMGDSRTTRLRSAAAMLVADVEYAQTLTVTRNDDPCVLVFEPDADRYYLARDSTVDTPLADPTTGGSYVVQFDVDGGRMLGGVSLGNLSVGDDDELSFGAFGQLDQSTDATVQLTAGPRSITVTFDASTGRATIGDLQ